MASRTGILLVVSGPSGCGKTTLCRRIAEEGEADYAISCTTRPMREGEQHGIDYFFLTREDFEAKIKAGEFLEHAEVHTNLYGTLKSEVVEQLKQGKDVVMDIDVQGAQSIRKCEDPEIANAVVDLFVMLADDETLRERLSGRGTDSEEVINLRMENALGEISHWPEYTYRLTSGSRDEDYTNFKSLLVAERMRIGRMHLLH